MMSRLSAISSVPSASRWRTLHPALRVFAVGLAWLACTAWMRPLFVPDEGRYAGVAWEMVRTGHWLTPTLDGMPFFHKPPLFYWITAAAIDLFGTHAWAARTASLLAGAATLAVASCVLRDWIGERPARLATIVLATQPIFFGAAQFANLDMLVAACVSIAVLLAADAAIRLESGATWQGRLAGAYAAVAMGVLAKGLIGAVLPMLVVSLWLLGRRRWRTLRSLVWGPGIVLAGLLVLPWFAAMQSAYPGFLYYFIVVQHVQRFAEGGFNNAQPFWFYLPVLAATTLPWSLWLWPVRRISLGIACPVPSTGEVEASSSMRASVRRLMGVWVGVVIVFFSIPQSKLVGYILPALAPLAVLIAMTAWPRLQVSARARRGWRWSLFAAMAVSLTLVVAVTIDHSKSSLELARSIDARGGAKDGIAFIDEYAYDLPFYLHDVTVVSVVADWDPAEVARHDNWRKELADAGRFAPVEAQQRLLDGDRFRAALCGGKVRWVLGRRDHLAQYPFLAAAELVATHGERAVWRADVRDDRFAKALECVRAPARGAEGH